MMKFVVGIVLCLVYLVNCEASIAGGNLQNIDSAGEWRIILKMFLLFPEAIVRFMASVCVKAFQCATLSAIKFKLWLYFNTKIYFVTLDKNEYRAAIAHSDKHKFGYELGENKHFHHTTTDEDGVRLGCYGHILEGKKYSTQYVADMKGYRVVRTDDLITVWWVIQSMNPFEAYWITFMFMVFRPKSGGSRWANDYEKARF